MASELVTEQDDAPPAAAAAAAAAPGADDGFDPQKVHAEAMELFEEWSTADQHNRDETLDDLNFQALQQWDELDKAERTDQRRPCFTVDMCGPFVRNIDGELRQNPLSIKSYPAEGGDVETAQVYGGLWRSIEEASNAERVFSLAGGQAAACGVGHFRGSFEFEHDDTFHQAVRLRSIVNPLAVVRDPSAILPDNTDLLGCFVYDDMPVRTFKRRWPNAATSPWPGTDSSFGNRVGWFEQDTVRVCEYWYVKMVPGRLVQLSDGQLLRDPKPEDLLRVFMEAQGRGQQLSVTNQRQIMRRKVCMVLMSGAEVLPKGDGTVGPYHIAGSVIPIFSVEGEVIYIQGKRVRRGLIRTLKDLQRIRNWSKSAEVETTAMAPRQKWLATHKMVKGRENMWRNANAANTATLLYEADKDAPGAKPERIDPPDYNDAAARLSDRTIDEARQATGMYAANFGDGNASDSGIKVKRLQQQGDTGNFLYIDNLILAATAAARWGAEVIPHVYDADRQVRILGEDMEPKVLRVNNGALDLNRGKYDLRYRAGPSFVNARAEAAEGMRELIGKLPPEYVAPVAIRLAKLQEWEGADELAAEFAAIAAAKTGMQPGMGGAPMLSAPGGGMPPQIAPGMPPTGINAALPAMQPNGGQPPVGPANAPALPTRLNASGMYEMDDAAMMNAPPPMGRPGLRIVSVN